MKKLLLPLMGAFLPFYGEAQITLTKEDVKYEIGDTLTLHVVTDTSLFDYGQAGANQVYDYSGLSGAVVQSVSNYVHENQNTDSIFSQADFYISDHPTPGQGSQHQYMVQNDSLLGNVAVQIFGANSLNIYYQGVNTNYQYPMAYGDAFSDSIQYYVDIISNGDGYYGSGENNYTIDGYGSLITDDTTVDVIRISYSSYLTESYNGLTIETYTNQIYYYTQHCPTPALGITRLEQYLNGNFNGTNEYLSFSDLRNYKNVTSVQNISVWKDLAVYPNPALESVQLKVEEAGTLLIYDISGRLMDQQPVEQGLKNLSIAHLQSGQYVFKIIGSSSVYTQTLMKM